MDDVILELIKIIPSLLWFVFVVFLIAWFYRPLKEDILPKIKTFEAAGVKFSLVRDSIDAAIKFADNFQEWNVRISEQAKLNVERRTRANISVFKGSFILWVDDHPENNLNERRMFKQLGADVDVALDTDKAIEMLKNGDYDLVISDMARDTDESAGLELLRHIKIVEKPPAVIFYIGVVDIHKQKPDGCFAITNLPDQLLHYILDILERKKY